MIATSATEECTFRKEATGSLLAVVVKNRVGNTYGSTPCPVKDAVTQRAQERAGHSHKSEVAERLAASNHVDADAAY